MSRMNGKILTNIEKKLEAGQKPEGELHLGASDSGVELGIRCSKCQHLTVLEMTADQADELTVDINSRAIEVRNGGGFL